MAVLISTALLAQKGKNKNKNDNAKKEARETILGGEKNNSKKSSDAIWDGTEGNGGPKPSKNQPAKVRAAFNRDYPNANNVRWSKYRGDWTATFNGGLITSTAVYHANGQRKDTRTLIDRPQLPKVILDEILKKRPRTQLSDIIKIQVPSAVKDIFRIKTVDSGATRFLFYDAGGSEVKYDY